MLFDLNKKIYIKDFYKDFSKLKNKLFFNNQDFFATFVNYLFQNKNYTAKLNSDSEIIKFKSKYANYIGSYNSIYKILKK